MERIGILHISDLHCSSNDPYGDVGDVKDEAISQQFRQECTYSDSRDCFFANALNVLRGHKIDAIACSGDLGQGGIQDSVTEGANYIARVADRLEVDRDKVIVSPGNHDLLRKAQQGQEFQEFCSACRERGFLFADYMTPAFLSIRGLPIIALNSCLGGTEHAFHGLPVGYQELAVEVVNRAEKVRGCRTEKNFDYQMQAMDIPAIGNSQREATLDHLAKSEANCAVIVSHHNLLPTPNLEVRPYASLVDSGPLLFGLIEGGRRVVTLSGHTHCDSTLTAMRYDSNASGLLVNICVAGLHLAASATVSYIEILKEGAEFLTASVKQFIKRGSDFSGRNDFRIWDISLNECDVQSDLSLDALSVNTSLQFPRVAQLLGKEANDELAAKLLRLAGRRNLSISRIEESPDKWIISRIG